MLIDENKTNKIFFDGQYVSGHASQVANEFKNNTYDIKGLTGIGGTHTILNNTVGHRILLMPNVGMIDKKAQGTYESKNQYFIHSESPHKWSHVKDGLCISDNVIIVTTPDQLTIIRTKDKDLYNQLVNIPVFVDEFHTVSIDSEFREVMGVCMALIVNEWNEPFKLSTATPNYNLIDVPHGKDVVINKLIPSDQKLRPLQISNRKKDIHHFIQSEHLKGHLVLVFSNDINHHISLKNMRVKNLVGQTLNTKLNPFGRGLTELKDLYKETDVIFVSSSYFAGFDVERDCSICIVSDQRSEATKTNLNNIVQAYGRGRKKVHSALFVNLLSDTTAKRVNNKNVYIENHTVTLDEVNKRIATIETTINHYQNQIDNSEYWEHFNDVPQITPQKYVNRSVILAPILNVVSDYQLYNKKVLKETLEAYGFELKQYANDNDQLIIKEGVKTQFNENILNLLKLSETELLKQYRNTRNNLIFKDSGNFSAKLSIQYLVSYLLKKTNGKRIIEMLNNKRVRPNEFYGAMDLYLRSNVDCTYYFKNPTINQLNKNNDKFEFNRLSIDGVNSILDLKKYTDDWQFLYAYHRVTYETINEIETEIKKYIHFGNVSICEKYVNDRKNRKRDAINAILNACKTDNIVLNASDSSRLKKTVASIYKALDNGEKYTSNNTRKNIKKTIQNALLYLMTDGKICPTTEKKNRVYSPITSLPTNMRCVIPMKYILVDLTSAFPQIVDSILNTNVSSNVYKNLMMKRNINRNEAKELFNKTLNSTTEIHNVSVDVAKRVYLDCGYPSNKALELAKITASSKKGAFYEIMTKHEKEIMANYSNLLPIKNYRFHDGLVLKLEDVNDWNISLTSTVKGYKYHAELFNSNSKCDINLTNINSNNGEILPHYYSSKSSA